MTIKNLLTVVPPPKKRFDTKGDWKAVRHELLLDLLGLEFPPDFIKFCSRYGSGRLFEGYLEVYNPLAETGMMRMKQELDMLRIARRGSRPLPLEVHPTVLGLLPWGHDENGHTYCWLTQEPRRPGDHSEKKWPVVFVPHGWAHKPEQFKTDMTTFLSRFATNKYPSVLPGDQRYTEKDRIFTPGRSGAEVYRNMKTR